MDARPSPIPEMPRHDADNAVLSAVLAEHRLSLEELARATGISPSFLSRVFAGQYAAPPVLIRALWSATRDHRVLRVALGDGALEEIPTADRPSDQRLAIALQAAHVIGRVADGLSRLASGQADPSLLTRDIDDTCRALRAVRSHLQTALPSGPGKVNVLA